VSNAAVISDYVRHNGRPEQAKKVVVFLAFALAYLFVVMGSLALVYIGFSGAPFYELAQVVALVAGNALMFVLLFYHRSETRDRWISQEAQRFLARRWPQDIGSISRWPTKIRRGMVWAPSLFVLFVFLFVPEFLGILSHRAGQPSLDQHRLKIPLTWIVADNSSSYVDSRLVGSEVWIVAGKGIGRVGLSAYWRKEEPVSEMTFSYAPYNPNDVWIPTHAKVLSTQQVAFGNESLICWDIIPYPDLRPKIFDPMFAEIICPPGNNGFRAQFSGWRRDSPTFYRVLQRASRRQ
jgi:hypothetical protein